MGGGRGHALSRSHLIRPVIRRAVDIARSPRSRAPCSTSPLLAPRGARDPARVRRARRSTASAASGSTGEPFDVLKLRTMVDGAEHIGAGLAVNDERLAHHARRRVAAPDLARRAAEPAQRAARRDVADRPAPDAAGAGRAVHAAPARAPADQARASPAGRRSTAAPRCPGASGSSSTSTTSNTARWRSTCGSSGARSAMVLGGSGLYKGQAGGWEGEL